MSPTKLSLADLRREYSLRALRRSEADPDPIRQFARWLGEAVEARLTEPNAMSLATASADGMPSSRIVLLKGMDYRGFLFFTNYESRKARELAANPRAALNFYWAELERQVCIAGDVEKTTREESETYFRMRPVGSQLGAWASKQSEVVPSREVIEEKLREVTERFADGEIPCPEWWGGYRVVPRVIEFWQGGAKRLHDRLRYTHETGGVWQIERLSP
jgi:pyridoxamine 5'-phosphate oxidase